MITSISKDTLSLNNKPYQIYLTIIILRMQRPTLPLDPHCECNCIIKHMKNLPCHLMTGEFQILEVDPWTQTPILVDIGTFDIPLLTHVLI